MTYLQDSEQETKEDETVNPESAAETTRFTGLAMPDKDKDSTPHPPWRGSKDIHDEEFDPGSG